MEFPVLKRQKTFRGQIDLPTEEQKGFNPIGRFTPELKYIDRQCTITNQMLRAEGATQGRKPPDGFTTLCSVGVGSGRHQRIGRKITIRSIEITGVVRVTANDDYNPGVVEAVCFVSLVWLKRTNGFEIASESVYTNPGTGDSSILCCSPLLNLEFGHNYVEMSRVILTTSPRNAAFHSPGTSLNGADMAFRFVHKDLAIPVTFNGDSDQTSDIVDNSFQIYGWSSDGSAQEKELYYNSRFMYTDV